MLPVPHFYQHSYSIAISIQFCGCKYTVSRRLQIEKICFLTFTGTAIPSQSVFRSVGVSTQFQGAYADRKNLF